MALRLRGAKTELEDASLDTDAMAESTSTLQAKLKALTHGKVDIMLDADTFKSTTQILREMSEAWEEMTDIERASALELMGGKRQANILASVIKNFDTVEDVIATSMDSEGSALLENEKYLSSIQGHIDQLNNSMQTMWMNFMDADVIKFFIDLATSIIKATDSVGPLQIAISALLAKTAFNADSFGQFFKIDINETTGKIDKFGFSLKGAATNAEGMGIAAKAASVGTQLLNSALTMGIALLASWVIGEVIKGLDNLIHANEKAAEAAEEALNAYENTQKTLKNQKSTVDELAASYEELSRGVDFGTNKNINLSTTSYQKYLDVCNDIADMYPHLVTGFDAQGNAILSLKGNVDDLTQSYEDAAQANRQAVIAKNTEIFTTFKNSYDDNGGWDQNFGLLQQIDAAQEWLDAINSGDDAMQEIYKKYYDQNAGLNWGITKDMFTEAGVDIDSLTDFKLFKGELLNVENLRNAREELMSFIKTSQSKVKTAATGVKTLMEAYLGEDIKYATLGEDVRPVVDDIISGLSADFINGFESADDLWVWIKTNVVDTLADPKIGQNISSAMSKALDLKAQFENNKIVLKDYQNDILAFVKTIKSSGLDETVQEQILQMFDIELDAENSLGGEIDQMLNYVNGIIDDKAKEKVLKLSYSDLEIINSDAFKVEEGTLLTWDQLLAKIKEVKIATTEDFTTDNFADYAESISAVQSSLSTYQEALEKLESGTFTLSDFMDLISQFPDLADGVDASSKSFKGLSQNLRKAIRNSPDDLVDELKDLRIRLVEAGKSTTAIDQLITSIENMPVDVIKSLGEEYATLADQINEAKIAQNELQEAMSENPNEGYETRGDAMEQMKTLMEEGKIGSESELWSIAEAFGFTYDSAKSINENADALHEFIKAREAWYATDDDGNYTYKGTESFINDVEKVVASNEQLQKMGVKWSYEDGALNFDFNNANWDEIVKILGESKELAGLTSEEFYDMLMQIGQFFDINWQDADDVSAYISEIAKGSGTTTEKIEAMTDATEAYVENALGKDLDLENLTEASIDALECDESIKQLLKTYLSLKKGFEDPLDIEHTLEEDGSEGLMQIKELQDAIRKNSEGLTVLDEDAFRSALEEAGYAEEQIDNLIPKVQEYVQLANQLQSDDPLGINGIATSVITVSTALDSLGVQYENIKDEITGNPIGLEINAKDLITTLAEKGWTSEQIKDYLSTLTSEENGINIKIGGDTSAKAIEAAIKEAALYTEIATAYVAKYEEVEGGADKTGLIVEALTAYIKQYVDQTGGLPSDAQINNVVGILTSYTEQLGEDSLSELQINNLSGMLTSYSEQLGENALSELQIKNITGILTSYTEQLGENALSDLQIKNISGVLTSYTEQLGENELSNLQIKNLTGILTSYTEQLGENALSDIQIKNLSGILTSYTEQLDDNELTGLQIKNLSGILTSYTEQLGENELSNLQIKNLSGVLTSYTEQLDDNELSQLQIKNLAGILTSYTEQLGEKGLTGLQIRNLSGVLTSYTEQLGDNALSDLQIKNIAGVLTSYTEELGENALSGLKVYNLAGALTSYTEELGDKALSNLQINHLVARIVKYVDDGAEMPGEFGGKGEKYVWDNSNNESLQKYLELSAQLETRAVVLPQLRQDGKDDEADAIVKEMVDLYKQLDELKEPTIFDVTSTIEDIDKAVSEFKYALNSDDFSNIDQISLGLDANATKDQIKAKIEEVLLSLEQDRDVVVGLALEIASGEVQDEINEFKKGVESDTELNAVIKTIDDKGLENLGLTRNEDGSWSGVAEITADLDDEQTNKVVAYLNLLDAQHTIDVQTGQGVESAKLELQDILDLFGTAYGLDVQANVDDSEIDSFIGWLQKTNISKTVSFAAETVGSWWNKIFGGNDDVNGTAHVRGTAYKGGSWGAPKSEVALTGELGPELRVRGNRWDLLGENGAEFSDIRKGDIIFNHKQTESLLSKGYVTGRGKAYSLGTAYVSGSGQRDLYTYGDTDSGKRYLYDGKYVDNDGKLTKAADALSSAASDAADEFREVFDWIEVRLEEINEKLSLYGAKLENVVGSTKQNAIIDHIIDLNQKLYDNLTAGAAKYYAFAKTLLAKVPAEYRKAAQDGSIAIEAFIGEVDEKTLEAIQNYREWVQKGADATQQAEETLTEISNLAKQAIDNIAAEYENKASIPGIKLEQLEAYNALLETDLGWESEKIYKEMIKANNSQIKILEQQRSKMQAEFNAQVEAGNIKKYSQAWYDAVNDIAAVDTEIINLTTDTEGYQDSINELHFEKFDNLMSRYDTVSDEASNLIDILGNEDLVDKDTAEWTDEGITSLGLYAQQMEVAEKKAQKYKEEIDYLNKNWKKLGYTEREYVEKLEDLKAGQYDSIKAYHDTKDAIVDLTKERVDAIKEGIEREIDAYSELIEKKKEELSTEKDLHDFQKDVADQQKEIADIERKLAALSADNSASARAKRAQLQADLLEAQAALEETYYDRSIEDQQNALDKELDAFTEEKNKEIEGWDKYLEDVNQVVSDGLATVQANTEAVYNTLAELGEEYSLSMSEAIVSPWSEGEGAIQSFSEQFGLSMSATVEELKELEKEFKQVMSEIDQAGTEATKKVNKNVADYTKSEYKAPKEETKKENNSKNENKKEDNSSKYTTYTVKGGDTLSSIAKNKLGSSSKWKDIYNLNKDIIKDPNLIHKGQKLKLPKYAKGVIGLKQDELAWIDELGEELIIRPQNGRMAFLEKGTDVIPADLATNLMEWGELDPSVMLERNKPEIAMSPSVVNNNMEISIDASVGELIHVDQLNGNDPAEVTKIVDKAWDKYMKNLNGYIRRYTGK